MPTRDLRPIVAYLGGAVLAVVLLVAAWAKAIHPDAFVDEIVREGLDFVLPARFVALVALGLEAGLGCALLLGVRRRVVLWPTAALVAFFVFLTGRAYLRFLNGEIDAGASCGCFGTLVDRSPSEAFWQDLGLLLPPLALTFVARPRGPFPVRRSAVAGLVGLATATMGWFAPDLPLDDFATRLSRGARVDEVCVAEVCLVDALPDLVEGEHLVVMIDPGDEAFLMESVDRLNEFYLTGSGPELWVVGHADDEQRYRLTLQWGAAFPLQEVPAPLLSSLYRSLPRSFRVEDGVVTRTWPGLPPEVSEE